MRILAYEHATATIDGMPDDVFLEGYAMLTSLVNELSLLGNHVLLMCLDIKNERIFPYRRVSSFGEGIDECDALFIIAPESGDTLLNLTCEAEDRGKIILGSPSSAIKAASDKWELYRVLENQGIRMPKTMGFGEESMDFPFVIKPKIGCGCEDVFLVRNEAEEEIVRRKIDGREKEFLCQEFVEGVQASVSLISNGSKTRRLSLNRQYVSLSLSSSYGGGFLPLEHVLKEKAFSVASQAVLSLGCKGYAGVDIVLSDDVYLIEVNPRLTTSYVGLSRIATRPIAGFVIDAVLDGKLPECIPMEGSVRFMKSIYGRGERIAPPHREAEKAIFCEVMR